MCSSSTRRTRLSNSGYSKGDAYGDEALQVLLKRAEDNRDHLVVILAGYPEGMDRLLAANPGLSSRFTTRVDFPSYRPLELTAIGEVLAAENGDVWDEEALDELRSISGHVVDQGWIDELGNGRFLRTLYEKSCAYRDLRLSGYPGTPTRDDLSTLRLPDLMQAYGEVLSGRGPRSALRTRRRRWPAGPGAEAPAQAQPAGAAESPAPAESTRRRSRASAGGRVRCCGGAPAASVGRVADLADQHLQHVLQRDQAQHPPGRVGDRREVRGGAAHHGEGVVQREFGAQRGHRSPHVLRHGPVVRPPGRVRP